MALAHLYSAGQEGTAGQEGISRASDCEDEKRMEADVACQGRESERE